MAKIQFDKNGGVELVRVAFLQKLKDDRDWNMFSAGRDNLGDYLEYVGKPDLALMHARRLAQDVFWELVIQGVLARGYNLANPNLPFFHLTDYGKKVLAEEKFIPHDPDGYLRRFEAEIPNADATVTAYVQESVECFARGNMIASVMMLGIAAERVFLLVSEKMLTALADPNEQTTFQAIMERMPLKPKLDFVATKIRDIMSKRPRPNLPDNLNIGVSVIYDFIRMQRNDLGHPRATPPDVSREDAFVNLRIFPTYYKMAEELSAYLDANRV